MQQKPKGGLSNKATFKVLIHIFVCAVLLCANIWKLKYSLSVCKSMSKGGFLPGLLRLLPVFKYLNIQISKIFHLLKYSSSVCKSMSKGGFLPPTSAASLKYFNI